MANEPAVITGTSVARTVSVSPASKTGQSKTSENEFVLQFGVEIERKEYCRPRVTDFSRKYIGQRGHPRLAS